MSPPASGNVRSNWSKLRKTTEGNVDVTNTAPRCGERLTALRGGGLVLVVATGGRRSRDPDDEVAAATRTEPPDRCGPVSQGGRGARQSVSAHSSSESAGFGVVTRGRCGARHSVCNHSSSEPEDIADALPQTIACVEEHDTRSMSNSLACHRTKAETSELRNLVRASPV